MVSTLVERLKPSESVEYPPEHLGLHWMQIKAADGRAIADLIHKCELYDNSLSSVSEDEVADLLEFGANGVVSDVIVGKDFDDNIRALAWVEIMRPDFEVARANVNVFIDPDWRGRGIGRGVLKWQDARARQLLVQVFGEDCVLPVRFANLVDSHISDRRRLYMAAGFSPLRTFQVMHRHFRGEEPEVAEPRGGYQIVPWLTELDGEILKLHEKAFADHWGTSADALEWWHANRPSMEKRWSFVAISPEGTVAGYILVCRHPARWIQTGVSEAYAELLGVDPDTRGAGLARALITKSMNAAYKSQVEQFCLDVDKDNPHGAQSFYQRLGFKCAGEQVFYALDM